MKEKGKTLLVITHDDGWYDRADRVVKLRDGQVESDVRKTVA
jgi:ABC-type siderophore export system fused ATPase/permease subunit